MENVDFDRLAKVLFLEDDVDRIPFYDLAADLEVIEVITGESLASRGLSTSDIKEGLTHNSNIVRIIEHDVKVRIKFYYKLGYDYVTLNIPSPFPRDNIILAEDTAPLKKGKRSWQNEHRGVIESREDFERYPWPDLAEDQEVYLALLKIFKRNLPEEMRIIPLTPGGVLENVMWLMGTVPFSRALFRDPILIGKMFDRVGEVISFYCDLCTEDESVGAMSMGDDMGYKSGPMISPNLLRKYVFPWQKKCVDNAHKHGKPFILHSCGNLKLIMEDLIEYVGIDAKHSYEDNSYPIVEYKKLYGDRIAVLGGVDMDKLSRMPINEFKVYVKNIIKECAPGGGYALGCGNTVANYIKLENYLTMLKIGKKYGRYIY